MLLKCFGFLLVTAGGVYCGAIPLRNAEKKRRLCRRLSEALAFLEAELSYRCTPYPELFQTLGEAGGATGAFFSLLARRRQQFPDRPWIEHFDYAREQTDAIPREAREALRGLFLHLGEQDLDSQLRNLRCAQARLEKTMTVLEEDRRKNGNRAPLIGLCLGLAAGILLL